ncbi:MAG: glycosyltransferase, partial [Planctomycetota bacterium]
EIHGILRKKNLRNKSVHAYLPNINLSLFNSEWNQEEARTFLGWPKEKQIYFMASRIDYEWKASDRFISAYVDFAKDRHDILLIVTGWGRDYETTRKLLEQTGVADKVVILSEAYSKPQLFRMYAAADVVVDQFKIGSLGSVSYEALCMGKPVITYLSAFAQMSYCCQPPVLNAYSKNDIIGKLNFCYTNREKLAVISKESSEWYNGVYREENLCKSVKICAEQSPSKWISLVEPCKKDLPDHKVQIPNHMATVRLLPWPHPYRAGMTISNDCEYYSWEDFCMIHQGLNSDSNSFFGPGLRLPISDSFWFFSEDPENLGFSYFNGTSTTRKSPFAPYMEELLKSGHLDTLHTFGGFDYKGSFKRCHAKSAIEELAKIGIGISVWTNHGNQNNRQNLGGQWFNNYQKGDIPSSEYYHADILKAGGVKYCSLDSYATNRFSLGNNRSIGYVCGLVEEDDSVWKDRLLCRDVLRDGQEMRVFRRFRGARRLAPDPSSLGLQLSDDNLDHLEDTGGAVIVYQHFGCIRDGKGRPMSRKGIPFPEDAIVQMKELCKRYYERRIWVSPCSSFIKYVDTVEQLRFEFDIKPEGVILVIFGYRDDLTEQNLAGVNIEIEGEVKIIGVEIKSGNRRQIASYYRVRKENDDRLYIYWPEKSLPSFPFTGKEKCVK